MHDFAQLLAVAALGATQVVGTATLPIVDGNSVGPLRIGMSANAARATGSSTSDRTESDGEGGTVRVLRLRIGGMVAAAEISDGKVAQISVRDPRLRTAQGFGVGTRLADMLRESGWQAGHAEGNLFVWNKRYCGLSFELNYDSHAVPASNPDWTRGGLAALPRNTSVTSILVRGCAE